MFHINAWTKTRRRGNSELDVCYKAVQHKKYYMHDKNKLNTLKLNFGCYDLLTVFR